MRKAVKKGYVEFLGEVKESIRKARYDEALREVNNLQRNLKLSPIVAEIGDRDAV